MKTYLITPFAEKDMAKALGARWDSVRKAWYVENVADLSVFARWLPGANAAQAPLQPQTRPGSDAHRPTTAKSSLVGLERSGTPVPHCGCDALPWEDCVHTRA